MELEKKLKNIETASEKIKKRLIYLYYDILKDNKNFESKYLILDCFDDLNNILISNHFLEMEIYNLKDEKWKNCAILIILWFSLCFVVNYFYSLYFNF